MNSIIEQSKDTLLRGMEEINAKGLQNQEALCNMEKLLKGYHYIVEMEMLEELGAEEYEREYGRYDRMYGRDGESRARRRGYRRNRSYGHDGGDMRMFLDESMRRATNEQERERIRRLMEEYEN